jgi:hypothetical protein
MIHFIFIELARNRPASADIKSTTSPLPADKTLYPSYSSPTKDLPPSTPIKETFTSSPLSSSPTNPHSPLFSSPHSPLVSSPLRSAPALPSSLLFERETPQRTKVEAFPTQEPTSFVFVNRYYRSSIFFL